MFPGVPTGLCPKGIMHSIQHGLKECEKTPCNVKKFTIKANMDRYHLPLPVMNGYFKQATPPKATMDSESKEHHSINSMNIRRMAARYLSLNTTPLIITRWLNCGMDLFINSGEMECILGIRVKVQVIPPPGERDPNSITKTC